jgi:hypothetical protein
MRRFHSARRRHCGSWTRCGSRPRTGDGAKTNAAVQRRGVVADLVSKGGIDAIFSLAQAVELPYLVGEALSQLELEPAKWDAILTGALTAPSRAHENVGLVATMFRRDGEAWATKLLSIV